MLKLCCPPPFHCSGRPAASLQFDTRQPGQPPGRQVSLLLAHLKSYQHMGTATVECVSGCTCKAATIDAHNRIRESTTHLFVLQVRPQVL